MYIHCTANAIELGPPDAIVKDPLSPVDEYCTIITEVTDIQIQYLIKDDGSLGMDGNGHRLYSGTDVGLEVNN
uniref:WGS project CBMI000000000 data, contig CS3069_c003527 n=1 Tax=Fusarium clavum TaxID=2594811 RepID=A0A090ME06_9HYPO|nr:unnamed protein product [Fusarium clavum]